MLNLEQVLPFLLEEVNTWRIIGRANHRPELADDERVVGSAFFGQSFEATMEEGFDDVVVAPVDFGKRDLANPPRWSRVPFV